MDKRHLSGRVTFARTQLELTQAELARRAGLDRSAIKLIEDGERPNPRAITVSKLAAALDVRTDWLISGEGLMTVGGRPQNPHTDADES